VSLDERELDRLLSRGRLGGPRHDEISQRVVARTRPRPARGIYRVLTVGALASGLLGAALIVVRPDHATAPLRSKGGPGQPNPSLTLTCLGGELAACPLGATLMFSVGGTVQPGYLAAYADPDPPGERVWYFSARGESPGVAASEGSARPLSRGIRLGPEHTAAQYRVHVLLTDRPLDPAAQHPPPALAEAIFNLRVVRP
jgi:hypothetical protein